MPLREQCAEIGIGRDQHALLQTSAREDGFIRLMLDTERPDMNRIVAMGNQARGNRGRQSVVDQKPHGAVLIGNVRSLTASAA